MPFRSTSANPYVRKRGFRILLVDDNEAIQEAVAGSAGTKLSGALPAQPLLEAASTTSPDIGVSAQTI